MSKKALDKLQNKHLTLIVVLLFAIVGVTILVFSKAATPPSSGGIGSLAAGGTSRFTLSPASGTYGVNASIPVTVSVSTSDNVNTVIANLTYNDAQLDFMSIDISGGVFTDCLRNKGGSGSVSINCGLPGTTATGNDLKVATVNFKVSTSGSSAISIASNSAVYKDDAINVWDGAASTANFTLGSSNSGGGGGGTTTPPPTSGGGSTSTPTSGTSGGSKATPKSTTSGGSSSTPSSTSNPTTTSGTGTPTTVDTSANSTDTVAATTPQKLNTNAIVMYAAVIGGAIAVVSVSGVAFAKVQRRNKFNRAHGMGNNNAVVFDANSSVHNPQTNSIDQGPIVTPTSTPTAPAAPQAKGPEGNIITPQNPTN